MIEVSLESKAELLAAKAERMTSFGGLNLLHIKREVANLLGQIGMNGIFDEYTRHDISHVNTMLSLLVEEIIPLDVQNIMTTADWLMIVLSAYFHDLGMLVTKWEYQRRDQSGFPDFRHKILSGDSGFNYGKRLERLQVEDRERFLYQEFVRENHPARIQAWIVGEPSDILGSATEAAASVANLLKPLGDVFRKDLGLVAESHHRDDLENIEKYKISQPYGSERDSWVNLQYAAVLLRTADLLHMTSDRTPSILFKSISPSDPLSQVEWAKQLAVRNVRAQVAKNSDGFSDEKMEKSVFEVHATFTDEEGFFGLSSYLGYVARELRQSHEWIANSNKAQGTKHKFPWNKIDSEFIETVGFEKELLSFDVDTYKILELLTGHTLYNDTGVVLRELIQNSLDAVRLQYFEPEHEDRVKRLGKISIKWDSVTRDLTIADNGTGMSESIIKDNLLKVGSSRYQEQRFREENPDFHPISRFGIGVLSAFMISDEVEYITCVPGENKVRRILLRYLHGKYLTRLISKTDSSVVDIVPNGTIVKLRLRPTANLGDVKSLAEKWIVVPACEVKVQIDNHAAETVGFASPKQALENYLSKIGIEVADQSVSVIQKEINNITLAYAVKWSKHFQEWSILSYDRRNSEDDSIIEQGAPGICVEGVRITDQSPGLLNSNVISLANARGHSAPKTNVARSRLESSVEEHDILKSIYKMYINHTVNEVSKLFEEREFSITWASAEAQFILGEAFSDRNGMWLTSESIFAEELADAPLILVEKNGARLLVSAKSLSSEPDVWSIDSRSVRSIENILREVPGSSSMGSLVNAIGSNYLELPKGVLICQDLSLDSIGQKVLLNREIGSIIVKEEQRRIDLRWVHKASPARWLTPHLSWPRPSNRLRHDMDDGSFDGSYNRYGRSNYDNTVILMGDIELISETKFTAIECFGKMYLLNSPLQQMFVTLQTDRDNQGSADVLWRLLEWCSRLYSSSFSPDEAERFISARLRQSDADTERLSHFIKPSLLLSAVRDTKFTKFSTNLWSRTYGDGF